LGGGRFLQRKLFMLTAIVRFRLKPGEDRGGALAEIDKTIPIYQVAGPALVRKAIHLDVENGVGTSVYLWSDRIAAERFFEMAKANIKAATGFEPEVTLMDVDVLIDNVEGTVARA